MEHPPHHQHRLLVVAHHAELLLERRHGRMHRIAVGGLRAVERRGVSGGEEPGRAQLHGVARARRERVEETVQTLDEGVGAAHQVQRHRGELEEQGPGLGPEPLHERPDHLVDGPGGVQEAGVGPPDRGWVRIRGRRELPVGLDQEAEVVAHHVGVGAELRGRDGPVERAVDADGAQQRVAGVGGQAVAGQHRLGDGAVVHDARPAGEAPRRGAQAQGVWELRGGGLQVGRHGGGAHRRDSRGRVCVEEPELEVHALGLPQRGRRPQGGRVGRHGSLTADDPNGKYINDKYSSALRPVLP